MQVRLRFLSLVAVVLMGALIVAGCGSGSDSSGSTGSTPTDESTNSGESTSSEEETHSIGLVDFSVSEPTSEIVLNTYESQAKAKGWDITRINPEASADKAVAAIQTLVQKDVDMIITVIFPSEELAGGVQAAYAAGIPIVTLGGGTTEGVQTNWSAGAVAGASDLNQLLIKDTGGEGKLLVLGYKNGLPCAEREELLNEEIESASYDVTRNEVPIPGQIPGSTNLTQAWLTQNPSNGEPMAVWGCFDEPSLGAIAAINQAKRSDVLVYGLGGLPAGIKALEEGDMQGEVWFNTVLAGEEMLDATPQYIEEGVEKKPTELPVPFEVVTPETVKEFVKEFPQAVK